MKRAKHSLALPLISVLLLSIITRCNGACPQKCFHGSSCTSPATSCSPCPAGFSGTSCEIGTATVNCPTGHIIKEVALKAGDALVYFEKMKCTDGNTYNVDVGDSSSGAPYFESIAGPFSGFTSANYKGDPDLTTVTAGLSFWTGSTKTDTYGSNFDLLTTKLCPTGQYLSGIKVTGVSSNRFAELSTAPICDAFACLNSGTFTIPGPPCICPTGFSGPKCNIAPITCAAGHVVSMVGTLRYGSGLDFFNLFRCTDGTTKGVNIASSSGGSAVVTNTPGPFTGYTSGVYTNTGATSGLYFWNGPFRTPTTIGSEYVSVTDKFCPTGQYLSGFTVTATGNMALISPGPICSVASAFPNLCLNGGTFPPTGINNSQVSLTSCTCPTGFSGTTCSDTVCPTCFHGGTCASPATSCTCPTGYSGDTCNIGTFTCPTGHIIKEVALKAGGGLVYFEKIKCTDGITYSVDVGDASSGAPDSGPIAGPFSGYTSALYKPDHSVTSGLFFWTGSTTTTDTYGSDSESPTTKLCPAGQYLSGIKVTGVSGNTLASLDTTVICSDPFCKNGGTLTANGSSCTCPTGFSGTTCSCPVCQNAGACAAPQTSCTCPTGYSGITCNTVTITCAAGHVVSMVGLLRSGSGLDFFNLFRCTDGTTKGVNVGTLPSGDGVVVPQTPGPFTGYSSGIYTNTGATSGLYFWNGPIRTTTTFGSDFVQQTDKFCPTGQYLSGFTVSWTANNLMALISAGPICGAPSTFPNLCLNGGTFKPTGSNNQISLTSCNCADGYAGTTCSCPVCLNSGTCDSPSTSCTCPTGYSGDTCTCPLCKNGGSCTSPDTSCTCPTGFTGSSCTCPVCMNGGTCTPPSTSCTCPTGFSGTNCSCPICQNSGTCASPSFFCTCPTGHTGLACECVPGMYFDFFNNCPAVNSAGLLGVFKDRSTNRDLGYLALQSNAMTYAVCAGVCQAAVYIYFGVQDGIYCWCGARFGRWGVANLDINDSSLVPCSGDPAVMCGGDLLNTIGVVALVACPVCQNGGICTSPATTCTCPSAFTGPKCACPVCQNGGICTPPLTSCTCPTGYSGFACGDAAPTPAPSSTDEVTPVPTSTEAPTSAPSDTAAVPTHAPTATNAPTDAPTQSAACPVCMNGGTCTPPATSCTCPTGFSGTNCSCPICQNSGTCASPSFFCTCPTGHTGLACECVPGMYFDFFGNCPAVSSAGLLGVFKDRSTNRDLGYLALQSNAMTYAVCAGVCQAAVYIYFGVQDGIYCWCGARFGRWGVANLDINDSSLVPCSGDPAVMCGGSLLNTIGVVALVACPVCQNGGICTSPATTCTCPSAFTGPKCACPVCQNGGICTPPLTSCTCPTGYSGFACGDAVPTPAPTSTDAPTSDTAVPTHAPTATNAPTDAPTQTDAPTDAPTQVPSTSSPTKAPRTKAPTPAPTSTSAPTAAPSDTRVPTNAPTATQSPTDVPTLVPSATSPTKAPRTKAPTSAQPTFTPTANPTFTPTAQPTNIPTVKPTKTPKPTKMPTLTPTNTPATVTPTVTPTRTKKPTPSPTTDPTAS